MYVQGTCADLATRILADPVRASACPLPARPRASLARKLIPTG